MFLVNPAMEHISLGTAGLVALLGYLVVFFGLALLMVVVMILGKVMQSRKKQAPAAAPVAGAAPAAPVKPSAPAPGSAGQLKLYDVPDRDAAVIMAIVANKMGRPLNELRFKSIKEVK